MLTTNLESGRVDYADPDATKHLGEEWHSLRENLGHHAQHEDEMSGLFERLAGETDVALRRLLGREFHRSMQHYTAICLSHFGAEEHEYTMEHMNGALDPVELDELRARLAS